MNNALKRAVTVAVTAVIAVAGMVAGSGAASATACPSTYTCTWDGFNYQGNGDVNQYIKFGKFIPDYRNFSYAGTGTIGDDTASSISNMGTTSTSYAFKDLSCTGYSFSLLKGTGDGNLSDDAGNVALGNYYGFNNSITSATYNNYSSSCRNS